MNNNNNKLIAIKKAMINILLWQIKIIKPTFKATQVIKVK